MPTDTPAAPRGTRRFVPDRYVIRVGAEWSSIRAATIWPIADVLDATACLEPPADAMIVLDLADAGLVAPPATKRRRDRRVSSRAVFYQAGNA